MNSSNAAVTLFRGRATRVITGLVVGGLLAISCGSVSSPTKVASAGASAKGIPLKTWLTDACPVIVNFANTSQKILTGTTVSTTPTTAASTAAEAQANAITQYESLLALINSTRTGLIAVGLPNTAGGVRFAHASENVYVAFASAFKSAITNIKKVKLTTVAAFNKKLMSIYKSAIKLAIKKGGSAERKATTRAIERVGDVIPSCASIGL